MEEVIDRSVDNSLLTGTVPDNNFLLTGTLEYFYDFFTLNLDCMAKNEWPLIASVFESSKLHHPPFFLPTSYLSENLNLENPKDQFSVGELSLGHRWHRIKFSVSTRSRLKVKALSLSCAKFLTFSKILSGSFGLGNCFPSSFISCSWYSWRRTKKSPCL